MQLRGLHENRCKHCNLWKDQHNSSNLACPIGSKHRTLGYTQYSETTKYESKQRKQRGK